MFSRPAYEVPADHELPQTLAAALARAGGSRAIVGASFWTDAAVLGHAGIPSILFGPGGAGLHSTEEYVNVADVLVCRDALVELVGVLGISDCRCQTEDCSRLALESRRLHQSKARRTRRVMLTFGRRCGSCRFRYAIRRALTRCGAAAHDAAHRR